MEMTAQPRVSQLGEAFTLRLWATPESQTT